MLFLFLILPFACFLGVRLLRLAYNYSIARKLGLPIIVLPASFEDPWWNILKPVLPWVQYLPFGLGKWYFYTDLGWPMVDGTKTTLELGETFILVSPTCNQIVTSYPPAVETIFKDYKTWIRPDAFGQLLAIYGQNLVSTNGTEWQRHRKITASAFNERTMRSVWEETRQSTNRALDFAESAERNSGETRAELENLALGVLTAVAFGQDTNLKEIPPGHRQTLVEALSSILKNVFVSIAFAKIKVPSTLLPKSLVRLKASIAEFQLYMEESVLRQMRAPMAEKKSGTLLEAMINANEAGKSEIQEQKLQQQPQRPSYLTDSEVYGNLFVFNLAGYETTAGTMTFTLPYLAAFPEIQDWVTQEVDAHYTSSEQKVYDDVYPKLVRCLAVMYETLRVASTAPQLVRGAGSSALLPVESASGDSRAVTVPKDTLISVHVDALHLSPRWGSDAEEFNPKRFVSSSPATGEEALLAPSGSRYIAWVTGVRVCPGKKFSQVEFVSVIAQVLSRYRIEVVTEQDESAASAQRRLRTLLMDKYFNGSAHLRRPNDAKIRFVKRHVS